MRIALALLALAVVSFLAPAAATTLPLPPSPVDSYETDEDGDHRAEQHNDVQTGQTCGCACPVVGAGTEWEAAGQEGEVGFATVILPFCGVALTTSYEEENAVDPLGPAGVDPYAWCWFYADPLLMDGDCVSDYLAVDWG